MKKLYLLPAALLIMTGISGAAYADDGSDAHNNDKMGHHWSEDHKALWELLPDDKVKLLHQAMENVHTQNEPLHAQQKKLQEELEALFKAPQFDQDAYLKKSAELDAVRNQMKKNKEAALAAVASKFTPEERKILLVIHHIMHHHHYDHPEHAEREHHSDKPAS